MGDDHPYGTTTHTIHFSQVALTISLYTGTYLIGRPYDGNEQKGVYIVTNRHGLACYAGQTRPSQSWSGAAAIRLVQHIHEESKRREWKEFWVLPLKWTTAPGIVNWYEKYVATRLGLPLRHRRIHPHSG